jgi:nitrate/nitrite transporter NarK
MTTLVVAGEMIFMLPFVVARVFRPTLLDVFGLTNLQLGTAFSAYGVVAMAAYFLGGPLADRFSARRLITAALVATALGGGIFASIPSYGVVVVLYGYWGLTTILLFWAALMRATREWGGALRIGRAYGILDGGRGLAAAVLASLLVAVFSRLLPTDVAAATIAVRAVAFGQVLWIVSGLTAAAAVLVWVALPEVNSATVSHSRLTFAGVRKVATMPAIWFQAAIIVCGYVGFKSADDVSLYARDVFGYDEVAAAQLGTVTFWVRPIVAVGAGLLADRIAPSRVALLGFGTLALGSVLMIFQPGVHAVLIATVAGTSVGIYSVRAIYYSLFGEASVPLAVTGSAVGFVSVIGYTPDVFMGPAMGYLLDSSPGILGHQLVFAMVAAFAVLGSACTLGFQRAVRHRPLT